MLIGTLRSSARPVIVLCALLLSSLLAPVVPAQAQSSVLLVDIDADLSRSACTTAPSDCSLRGAITRANASSYTTIMFDAAVRLIPLLRPLPALTGSGARILGNAGMPRLDAAFMAAGDLLTIDGPDIGVSGLSFVNGSHPYADIHVIGGSAIQIYDNYLGTLPPSSDVVNCWPNPGGGAAVTRNSSYGLRVEPAVQGSSARYSVYLAYNTIGCHSYDGVLMTGSDYARIEHNWIGLNSHAVRLANSYGVQLMAEGGNGARYNRLISNTIGGNERDGIRISGTGSNNFDSSTGNMIEGNAIGLIPPSTPMGNRRSGIQLVNGVFMTRIGGELERQRNLLSGNDEYGIAIEDSDANGVLGNYIGLGSGGEALGNGRTGVSIRNGKGNLVGGFFYLFGVETRPNVIASTQGWYGVEVRGSGARDNMIYGNLIGTDPRGASPRPNARAGIMVSELAETTVITGNLVAHSGWGDGIQLDNARNPKVTANTVHHSGWSGIGLAHGTTGAIIGGPGADKNVLSLNARNGIRLEDGSANSTIGENELFSNTWAGLAIQRSDNIRVSNIISYNNQEQGIMLEASHNISLGGDAFEVYANRAEGIWLRDTSNVELQGGAIWDNALGSVVIGGGAAFGNRMLPALISDGHGHPVLDLGRDGLTPNDPGDADSGPNALLNYPTLSKLSGSTISGTACAGCTVLIYQALGNPALGGQIQGPLMRVLADAAGSWSATLVPGTPLDALSFAACESWCGPGANMSEFSPVS